MGRGRAKAKQTKVARELKYSSGNTDLNALQAELTGSSHERPAAAAKVVEPDEDDDDLYAKYIEDEDED